MKYFKIFLAISILEIFTNTSYVQALPGMTSSEVVNWSKRNPVIAPLILTEKFEPGYSDYDSTSKAVGGTVKFSVFLDDNGLVLAESIYYTPNCYPKKSLSCSGNVQLTKADRGNGQILIREIWGKKLLNDFQNSKLIDTVNSNGTHRWYQGKLYNYETFHYENNSIVDFSIFSKTLNQTERIQGFRACLKKICD